MESRVERRRSTARGCANKFRRHRADRHLQRVDGSDRRQLTRRCNRWRDRNAERDDGRRCGTLEYQRTAGRRLGSEYKRLLTQTERVPAMSLDVDLKLASTRLTAGAGSVCVTCVSSNGYTHWGHFLS